ncbi:MAG: hypothetical protein EZS28_021564 [Streblomastix strix]|uniref:Uncharacterized protein n=1 Tax=Streblomastix strix TaxID=222440 RepID=A0A5J4VKP0_9EUKA|nr:MAG: hypothetical protein EZS28_021564 [Streblomastix strix]
MVTMGTAEEDDMMGHDILAELETPVISSSLTPVKDLCTSALVQVLAELDERVQIKDDQKEDQGKTASYESLKANTRSQSVLRTMIKDQTQIEKISTNGLADTALIVREAIRNRMDFFWDVTKDVRTEISKDAEGLVEIKPPERSEEHKIPKATEEAEEALKAIQKKFFVIITMLLGVNTSMLEGFIDSDKLEVALAISAETMAIPSAARRRNIYKFHQNSSAREMRTDPSFNMSNTVKEKFLLKSFHEAKKAEKPSKSGFFQQKQTEKTRQNGLFFVASTNPDQELQRKITPLGGALKQVKQWEKLGLTNITNGLQIPWSTSGPPSGTGLKTCIYTKNDAASLLRIQMEVLQKRIFVQTNAKFFSPEFLVTEPDGKDRFILNTKMQNIHMAPIPFKMENHTTIAQTLWKEAWLTKFDLIEAQSHLSISEIDQQYLRFWFGITQILKSIRQMEARHPHV